MLVREWHEFTPHQQVCEILDVTGASFDSADVLASDEIREGIKKFSNWPTIPQLYIQNEFVGGCDLVTELYTSGELKTMLEDAGAIKIKK